MKHVLTGKVFLLAEHLPNAAAKAPTGGDAQMFPASANPAEATRDDGADDDASYTADPSQSGVHRLAVHRRTPPSGPQ